jgi:DNA-directed RNA polymerase III subunit RPC1
MALELSPAKTFFIATEAAAQGRTAMAYHTMPISFLQKQRVKVRLWPPLVVRASSFDSTQGNDRPHAISEIRFGLMSGDGIVQSSHIPVVSKQLYELPSREPVKWGVLDPILGKIGDQEPVGRFGHIELALPVFHIGFFKATIATLQCVCKTCSRVLLPEPARSKFIRLMRSPMTDSLRKVKLRKAIIDLCKKQRACPWCLAPNGQVKRIAGAPSFRIVHDLSKLTGSPPEDMVKLAVRSNADLESFASEGAPEVITPDVARAILVRIPDSESDLLWVNSNFGRPEDLILTRLAVPPLCIRPSVPMDAGGGSNEDDLTVKLQEIVAINTALLQAMAKGSMPRSLAECWDLLQVEVGAYINGELPGLPPAMRPRRPIRALCQRLKGKQGRFRGNLSGKRVDFSARTVISPDPNLPVHCVAVPIKVAQILTYPERVTEHNIQWLRQLVKNGPKYPGANVVRSSYGLVRSLLYANREQAALSLKVGDVVERHLKDDDIVLFNRQPSLHKMSIMCHRARVRPSRTFRFNECVCSPYNADFDGDEMNLHLPQTEEARAEAGLLMDVRENLVTSRSGEPLIAACQDFITAAFLLTQRNITLTREQMMQAAATLGDGEEHVQLPIPAVLKPMALWTGKQLFNLLLSPGARRGRQAMAMQITLVLKGRNYTGKRGTTWPGAAMGRPDPWGGAAPTVGEDWGPLDPAEGWVEFRDGRLLCGNLCKSALGSNKKGLVHALIRDFHGRSAARCLLRLTRLCTRWLTDYGFSIGIEDVMPSEEVADRKETMVTEGYDKCIENISLFHQKKLPLQPGCDEEQSLEAALNGILGKLRDTIGSMCVRELPFHNAPRIMAACGSKGSTLNICQMIACVGQQSVGGARIANGFVARTLPAFLPRSKEPSAKGFVANSFLTGLNASEFFFHTMGGREGLVDTAVKTAETGYMQRRMIKALEDLSVQYDMMVRNSAGDVVQFRYGDDGLDPSRMMSDGRPVEFDKLLESVRVANTHINEISLLPHEIEAGVESFLGSPEWEALCTQMDGKHVVEQADDEREAREWLEFQNQARKASGRPLLEGHKPLPDVYGAATRFTKELRAFVQGLSSSMRLQRRDAGLEPDSTSMTNLPPIPGSLNSSARSERRPTKARDLYAGLRLLSFEERSSYMRGQALVADSSNLDPLFGEVILDSLFRVTSSQLKKFLAACLSRFDLSSIQPGEAVGAVAAHSMGEPATQMTLKTFHFAGVASMNVTLGVPRIKEIINAAKSISTPIIEAALVNDQSEVAARVAKGFVEKTCLGEVSKSITEVYTPDDMFLEVALDLEAIDRLNLPIDSAKVAAAIVACSKLKLKASNVRTPNKHSVLVSPPGKPPTRRKSKATSAAEAVASPVDLRQVMERGTNHVALQNLRDELPSVIVSGIPTVSRAVITQDEASSRKTGNPRYQLLVEGEGLLQVMGSPGIDGRRTVSNHIAEVESVLGIEAARVMIMRELNKTYGSYGIEIDPRHLMLLADVMTYRGEVLGITRFGIAKMKDSVVMLASFERTPDHLFDAAVHSRQDQIKGVSECIVVGRPCGLGTGAFKLGLDVHHIGLPEEQAPSHETESSHSAALNARQVRGRSHSAESFSSLDPDELDLRPPQQAGGRPPPVLRHRSSSVASETEGSAASCAELPPKFSLRRGLHPTLVCNLLPKPRVPVIAGRYQLPDEEELMAEPGHLGDGQFSLGRVDSRAGLGARSGSYASASSASSATSHALPVSLDHPTLRARSSSASSASSIPLPEDMKRYRRG